MARKKRSGEQEEEPEKPVVKSARITRSSTQRAAEPISVNPAAKLQPEFPKRKKPKVTKKEKNKETDELKKKKKNQTSKGAEVETEKEEETALESDGEATNQRTIVIEHCKQCNSFKTRAAHVKNGIEKASIAGITVLVNPDKPRRGCFEVRDGDGEKFISLLDMKRPFTLMKQLNMDEVVSEIVEKINDGMM